MKSLSHKSVLLIIGGGISAYKSLDLIRRLKERGAGVTVVLTAAAKQFITPLSAASLSGSKVYEDLFSLTDEAEMGHIELSRAADLIVVAPATADLLAKQAHGLANDLASTLLLATDKRVLNAPAMNLRMWLHPATRRNVATLTADGALFVGPNEGDMACGEYGPGRMAEPLEIVNAVEMALQGDTVLPLPNAALQHKHVLIAAGPTHEPIDPVRYIANRSSGKQGYALAEAAKRAGARVTLVSGPVNLPAPVGVTVVAVETADHMLAAVELALPADIFIAAAAVADWSVVNVGGSKIKKQDGALPKFELRENADILASVASGRSRPALVVGFAAETDHMEDYAKAKLVKKGCDIIVANDVSGDVMGGDNNQVTLISPTRIEHWPHMSKQETATKLMAHFAGMLSGLLK